MRIDFKSPIDITGRWKAMPAASWNMATRSWPDGRDGTKAGRAAGRRWKRTGPGSGVRAGFTIVELLAVMILVGIVLTIALPRLNFRALRIDGATKAANMVLLAAQRTAIQKQHNVVVAFDTVNLIIRVHEDANNDGVIDASERVRNVPLGDGTRFGLGGATARAIGGASVTFTRTQGGLPALTFSRAGTASEIGGFYISSRGTGSAGVIPDTRALEVERSTGRTERFMWNAATNAWIRVF
jgi:prepilin-type N-terminal cleavage/methylation domain-containing protein